MKIIAGVLIKKDYKYLLVQEKKEDAIGLWNIPAGHVDKGETFEEAAKREGEEETGYKIKLGEKVGEYNLTQGEGVMHIFKAEIIRGKISFDKEELLDVKWFSSKQIQNIPLREKFLKVLLSS